jgi:hypothetical protein
MDSRWITGPILLAIVAIGLAITTQKSHYMTFQDSKLLERGLNTPTIWLYYDDTEVNSRWWSDFGSRSNRVLNLPFLNLCYNSIVKAGGVSYHVEVIGGLADAARRLGGWEELPPLMRNKRLPLGDEEKTYLRVAFLEKFGGLWMNPATICLKPFPVFPKDHVVFFGTDPSETYTSNLPNQAVVWSPAPKHPLFVEWRANLGDRIERAAGGREARNDKNWDLVFVTGKRDDVIRESDVELTRKKGGRKIELEDLLAAGTGGDLPFDIPASTLYVPIPYEELLERRIFGWFLRLSEEQIMESDLAIKYLFQMAGVRA